MKKEEHKKIGRPLKINNDVLRKLEEAFSLGCTDEEACIYANIGMSTLYDYQKRNPTFTDRKRLLKHKPVLKARKAVDNALTSDDEKERSVMARWYLEHKKSGEFNTRSEVAVAADGVLTIEERSEALNSYLERFNID